MINFLGILAPAKTCMHRFIFSSVVTTNKLKPTITAFADKVSTKQATHTWWGLTPPSADSFYQKHCEGIQNTIKQFLRNTMK